MFKAPHQVADFIALPITFKSTALGQNVKQYIYLKAYEPKLPDEESPRAIFAVNIPVTSTEAQFRHLFSTQLSCAGRIQHIHFADQDGVRSASSSSLIATTHPALSEPQSNATTLGKRKRKSSTLPSAAEISSRLATYRLPAIVPDTFHATGSTAIIVFLDRAARDLALRTCRKAARSHTPVLWSEGLEASQTPALGRGRYAAQRELVFPARAELLRHVDEYMTAYAELEAARARETAKLRAEPDEDGFVTVTRGSKGVMKADEAQALKEKVEAKKRRSGNGLEDFYRFQMRERRKEEQGKLLRQFEEEKRKVEEMRKDKGKVVSEN